MTRTVSQRRSPDSTGCSPTSSPTADDWPPAGHGGRHGAHRPDGPHPAAPRASGGRQSPDAIVVGAFERAGDEIPYPQTVLDGTLPTDALVTALMPALCGSPNSTVCSSVLPGEELGPASAPGQHAQRHGQAGAGHGEGGDVDVAHQQASQQ